METWFPERLPVHFHSSKGRTVRGGLAGRAPMALLGGAFALAAAVAVLRRIGMRRRGTDLRSPGGRPRNSGRRGLRSRNLGGS